MRRRLLIVLIISAIVTRLFAAMARQQTYRLGCLLALPRDAPENIAFFEELHRRGFVEGQNLTVEYRAYGLHLDMISLYAAELVNAQVDVIIARGDDAIRAAQQATKTIPILAITGDMLGSGLVNSLVRPNGNTTGVSMLAPDFDRRRQHILVEAVPGLRRMAALVDVSNTTVGKLDALQVAARARNIELSIHRIAGGEEIPAAIELVQASGARALNVLSSPLLYATRQLIVERVAALRLPAIYGTGRAMMPIGRHSIVAELARGSSCLRTWLALLGQRPERPRACQQPCGAQVPVAPICERCAGEHEPPLKPRHPQHRGRCRHPARSKNRWSL